ncbi:MAG TPA: hypothetical protein PK530_19020, partial [Anaerolineales bacterium]|nr:hypothetical protein [Anaerolineales bacterium]
MPPIPTHLIFRPTLEAWKKLFPLLLSMILFGVIAIIPRNSLGMILALFSFGVALFMVIVLLSHYIEIT